MKRIFLFILASLILHHVGIAQTGYQPFIFQSPEVSSLTNDVKTPVSLSSGTIAVDVPLYTLQEGDITVPISLSYDASGVKVDAQPAWVGQNWSLRAGGMISRIVKGVPDETYVEAEIYLLADGQNHITNYYPIGVRYNLSKLKNANWNETTQIETWAKNEMCELEPDEFIFNFCGHSGKFYMNEDGQFVSMDKKYKISALVYLNIPMYDARIPFDPNQSETYTYYKDNMMSNGMGGYIGGFVQWRVSRILGFCITDPEGVKYYFGSYYKDENQGKIDIYTDNFREIEITADFFSQFFEEEFSAWYLERIVSPRGNTVEFKYETGHPTVSFSKGYSSSYMSGSADSGLSWLFGGKVSASSYSAGPNMSGKFIRPVYLSEIVTPNESIQFGRSLANTLKYDYGLVDYHLSLAQKGYYPYLFIPVYTGQLPIIDGYVYNPYYGYIKVLNPNLLQVYKLDNISVRSSVVNRVVKKYNFNYEQNANTRLRLLSVVEQGSNSQNLPPTTFSYNTRRLPGFFDEEYDHWGYYNGKTVLESDYGSYQYYQKREPNASYMTAEILEKITYPTGGSKTIVYEPNKYNRVITRNTSSGALSLSTTSEKVGGGLRVKEIIENDGTNNYTTRYTYSPGILNGEIQYYWGNYTGKLLNGNTYNATRFLSNSILPVSNNSDGGSVSYSSVTESQVGNGRIEYSFSNHDNRMDENGVSIDLQKSPYSPLSSRVIERGKLLESRLYKEGGTSPIKKETYLYSILGGTPEYIRSVYLRRLALFGSYYCNAVEGSAYKIYIYPYNVTRKTEYFYDSNNNSLINENLWTYDSRNSVSSQTLQNSGNSHKVTYKYAYDYSTVPYTLMAQNNMISPAIETITTVNSVETERVKINYTNNSHITNGAILPGSVQSSFSGSGNLLTTDTFVKYDSKGHLLQITDKKGVSTCYIWGYGGNHVVAEIKNATLAQVKNISGLSNIEHTALTSGLNDAQDSALRALPNTSVTTFKFEPLVGVSEIRDDSGRKTQYIYDDFGRLKSITDDQNNPIQKFEYNVTNQ
ncbi:MAG: RHS repeat protein [Alistipes sp.]|jgi:YD repeat-containing protein|nr:RHS repeat protein [Alistipes sp.]